MNEDDDDIEFTPPTVERVRRRAWAISSIVCRAFIENFEDTAEAAILHSRVLSWIDAMDLRSEFEANELAAIEADIGSLDQQTLVNGTWRSEGLIVLAWALNAAEIPSHDQMVDPSAVANSLFFFGGGYSRSSERIDPSRRRPTRSIFRDSTRLALEDS